MARDYHKTGLTVIRIEDEYREKLATIAAAEEKSMTQVVRDMLDAR